MNSHLSKYLTRPVPKLPSEISLRRRVRDDFTNEFTYKPLPIFDKRTETTEFSDHARYAKVKRFEEVLNHVSEKKPLELEPADLEPEQEPEPEQEQEPEPEPIVEHAVLEPLPRKKAVPIRRVRDEFAHPFREIDANWKKGLPKKTPLEKLVTKASSYYMSNRKQFTAKLLALFRKFSKKEKEPVSCQNENAKDTWIPLIHQQLVREYLNLYTPYRGLLLYHGLGSGKTCASIAIAEAAKSEKRVFIMTPASLKSNFFAELKKCADPLYKQNQYWQFVSTEGREPQFVREISKALSVPWELVEKHRGVWLMDVRKHTPNFGFLDAAQQHQLSAQLDAMIREKYVDIHYNGLNGKKMDELIAKYGTGEDGNPFHDSVVIVDEAHNLVSRIVNKLETPDGNGISMRLYNWLQEAQNARIVFLSGTPVVNFANEMAVMFNMLRGKIATWTFKLENAAQLNGETLLQLFAKHNFQSFDYIDYSDGILKITRNPFGFVNVYTPQEAPQEVVEGGLRTQKTAKKQPLKGSRQTRKSRKNGPVIVPAMKFKKNKGALELPPVEEIDLSEHIKEQIAFELHQQQNGFGEEDPNHSGGAPVTAPNYLGVKKDENGNIDDRTFVKTIQRIFREEGIGLAEKQPTVTYFQCLPDNKTVFEEQFVDVAQQTVKSSAKDTLKKRILGLASYFRSAQESLLPETVHPDGDKSKQYFIEAIPMSDHQWKQYLEKRQIEINMEMNAMRQKKEDRIGVYRTFTRAACNFVFPEDIKHPKAALRKRTDEPTEDDFVGAQEDQDTDTDTHDSEEIRAAFNLLAQEPHRLRGEQLMELSPKFHRLLENLQHPEHDGLHMVYSAFRTVEGIGALKVVLEANGFEEFKLERTGNGGWQIANFDVQSKKPRFALHTGTESPEEKTVLRNIFNSHWENIPHNLAQQLQTLHGNNFFGEIVKVIMITASGAEGINLENTRFVHIVEPYWHGVRLEQVVGRARRICSHQRLPEDKRTVQTFMYLATFSEDQLQSRDNWRTVYDADLPKDENGKKEERPITTDEFLLRIMLRKDKLNQSLLQCIQESSIDCAVHDNELECFSFGQTNKKTKTEFGTHPDIQEDLDVVEEGKETKRAKVKEVWIDAKPYAWNAETDELYDFHKYSAKRKVVDVVGTLEDKRQEKAEILQKNLIKYQFIFNDGSQEPLTLVYSKDTDKLYSYSDGIHAKPLRYYLNKADNHEIEIKSKKI